MNINQQKLFYVLLTILLFLVIGFSVSYSYVNSIVSGNINVKDDVIQSHNGLEIDLDGTSQVTMTDIEPGNSLTKSFSVTNKTSKAITSFTINVSDVINTYAVPSELVYIISCTASVGTCNGKAETVFPTSSAMLMSVGNINPGITYNYIITITLKEMGSDQSYNATGKLRYLITINNYERLLTRAIFNKDGTSDEISSLDQPSFDSTSSVENNVYSTNDQDGLTYYYRGTVSDNYVSFANKIWRIVRINGDGTVRMILNSYAKDITSSTYFVPYNGSSSCANNTITSQTAAINCVKYKNSDYAQTGISTYVEDWYSNNIDATNDKYVATSKFCNNYAFNTSNNQFVNLYNLNTLHSPSLQCKSTGSYTSGLAETISMKVGLITADELSLAGGVVGIANSSYYLYIGTGSWWTMTPRRSTNITAGTPEIFKSSANYSIDYIGANSYSGQTYYYGYIRPVINLKANTIVTGEGTITSPYVISRLA